MTAFTAEMFMNKVKELRSYQSKLRYALYLENQKSLDSRNFNNDYIIKLKNKVLILETEIDKIITSSPTQSQS